MGEDDWLVCWTFLGLARKLVKRPELGGDAGPIWLACLHVMMAWTLGLVKEILGLGPKMALRLGP